MLHTSQWIVNERSSVKQRMRPMIGAGALLRRPSPGQDEEWRAIYLQVRARAKVRHGTLSDSKKEQMIIGHKNGKCDPCSVARGPEAFWYTLQVFWSARVRSHCVLMCLVCPAVFAISSNCLSIRISCDLYSPTSP